MLQQSTILGLFCYIQARCVTTINHIRFILFFSGQIYVTTINHIRFILLYSGKMCYNNQPYKIYFVIFRQDVLQQSTTLGLFYFFFRPDLCYNNQPY